ALPILRVLLAAVVVHAAAGMAMGLVAQVEPVVLVREAEAGDERAQVGVALAGATLAATRGEAGDGQADRRAGAAAIAVRAVGEHAATPEAGPDQLAVDVGVDEVVRGGDLGSRLAL